jgi:hypothetical protein
VRSKVQDTTPDAFDFTPNVTNAALSTLTTASAVTISGINTTTPVSVTGAGAQISINGGAWGTSGNITNGQTLAVRVTSSAAFSTAMTATVDVGGVTDTWSVTTLPADTTPDAFDFTPNVTNAALSTLTTAGALTITGINTTTPVSVTGTGAEISIAGGAWGTSGNITNGQTLAVRLTSSAAYLTTLVATVTVGGTNDSWSVQTRPDVTVVNISANASNVNLFTLAGSPTTAGNWEFRIGSGVYVYSTSTATAAITTGAFPAGSTITVINNGYIIGKGGNGGKGGNASGSSSVAGAAGAAGGPAISLAASVTITNASGFIYGGGGGGGGGGGYNTTMYSSTVAVGAGGGGGGRSYSATSGGGAGTASAANFVGNGTAGGGGSNTAAGAKGVGGSAGGLINESDYSFDGADGGIGGVYGAAGANGVAGTATRGTGGAAGKAVALNGYTVTWISGNDSTHVKGAVN